MIPSMTGCALLIAATPLWTAVQVAAAAAEGGAVFEQRRSAARPADRRDGRRGEDD